MESTSNNIDIKECLLNLLKEKTTKSLNIDKFTFDDTINALNELQAKEHIYITSGGFVEPQETEISNEGVQKFFMNNENSKYFGIKLKIIYESKNNIYDIELKEAKLRQESLWYFWKKYIIETKKFNVKLLFLS